MESDLKSQNVPTLTAIYIGAFLLVATVHWGVEEVFVLSRQLGRQILVVAAITGFGGALSSVLSNYVKHSLVYFRFRNALSGHRCRRICMRDPRLQAVDIERKWPALFDREMTAGDQNTYWYGEIYRRVRNRPEVVQAHRSFLLYRDAAAGLAVVLGGLLFWKAVGLAVSIPPVSIWALSIVVGMLLLLCRAAQQSGDRMVANAVAVALHSEVEER